MSSSNDLKISYGERNVDFFLPVLFFVSDYVSVVAAEACAYWLRNLLIFDGSILQLSWLNTFVIFPFLYIAFIHAQHLYSVRIQFWQIVQRLFAACGYAILAIIVELYVSQLGAHTSRLFIALMAIFSFVFFVVTRFVVKKLLRRYEFLQIPVLIVGAGRTAEALVNGITGEAGLGYRIIGFLEDGEPRRGLRNYPVLGRFDEIEDVIQRTGVRHVIIAAPGISPYKQGELLYRAKPLVKNVGVVPNLIGMPMGGLEVESLFSEKLMLLKVKNNLAYPLNRMLKLFFDYTFTILGTIFILPILVMVAIWIYKDSPGPVLFKHVRIGKDGKPFGCYKFRSMCVDAKERLEELLANDSEARAEWERGFKLKNDPRITRSGAFLRKTSLDELPQIFNVLKGEMSLVGPRPVVEAELPRYGNFVQDYLSVKPGITGYWQVNGRSDTTYAERVQMDTWYVQNWSIWLDIMLLWRTFKAVIAGKGAY